MNGPDPDPLNGVRPGGGRSHWLREPLAAEPPSLAAEIHPIDDVRSTADYRRVVAARALHRMIRDAGGW